MRRRLNLCVRPDGKIEVIGEGAESFNWIGLVAAAAMVGTIVYGLL